ncbi:antitoxin [Streptomyces sp. NPDC000410]|uniref:antitoxin n=1 Tax=Streptomyces sp. NPDC000410 TaxID=3154254 RepID=UPI003325E06B
MGIMDTLKAKFAPAKEKVSDKVSGYAQQHGDKIDKIGDGLDKAARKVDERTKGKYSDKIESGTGKAKDALDRLAHKDDDGTGRKDEGTTPPPAP